MARICWGLSVVLVVAAAVGSAIVYPKLPETVPIHWNFRGEADGFGSRAVGAFLMPAVMAGLLALFAALPRFSPPKTGMGRFRSTYAFIVLLAMALMLFLHILAVSAGMGRAVSFPHSLMCGLYVFLTLLGNVLGQVTPNPYVGIRTPWTLASERVWNATHRLGAWMFAGSGVLGLILVAAEVPLALTLLPLVGAVIVPVVYSFLIRDRSA